MGRGRNEGGWRRRARRLAVLGLGAAAAGTLAAGPARSTPSVWTAAEDPAGIPPTAQVPRGSGPLTVIKGRVSHFNDDDMFKICLTGGGTFRARVVPRVQTPTFLDPQLFLFDRWGRGVYANDDRAATGTFNAIHPSLPAGHPLTPTEPGPYFLAISAFDNDPLSSRGLIFPDQPFDAVLGPTGPGGGRTVVFDWSDNGSGTVSSDYTIRLRGAVYC
jgi:hypothetical protein